MPFVTKRIESPNLAHETRKATGLTCADFAALLGLTTSHTSKLCTGAQEPSESTRRLLLMIRDNPARAIDLLQPTLTI